MATDFREYQALENAGLGNGAPSRITGSGNRDPSESKKRRWGEKEERPYTRQPDHLGAAIADQVFSILMGEDVDARRSFIQRNAKDVRFLDI